MFHACVCMSICVYIMYSVCVRLCYINIFELCNVCACNIYYAHVCVCVC